MADLPITSDEGATPVVINDPVTAANVAGVNSLKALQTDITTVASVAVATAAAGIQKVGMTDGSGNPTQSFNNAIEISTFSQFLASEGDLYSIVRDATPALAAESNFILLKNPNASGVILYIFKIISVAISSLGSATGVESVVRLYSNPTITANGTAMTINNQLIGSADTSLATAFSVPTTTANGNLIRVYAVGSQGLTTLYSQEDFVALQANNNLLVTVQGTVNGPSEVAVNVVWGEV
jgi:hypothetical protein